MSVAQSMAKTGVVLKGALRLEKENRRSAKWYAIKNQQSVVQKEVCLRIQFFNKLIEWKDKNDIVCI